MEPDPRLPSAGRQGKLPPVRWSWPPHSVVAILPFLAPSTSRRTPIIWHPCRSLLWSSPPVVPLVCSPHPRPRPRTPPKTLSLRAGLNRGVRAGFSGNGNAAPAPPATTVLRIIIKESRSGLPPTSPRLSAHGSVGIRWSCCEVTSFLSFQNSMTFKILGKIFPALCKTLQGGCFGLVLMKHFPQKNFSANSRKVKK